MHLVHVGFKKKRKKKNSPLHSFGISGPDVSAVLAWQAMRGIREHRWIRCSNETEGLVWLDLWNALNMFLLAGRVRWPGSCERTHLPSCYLMWQPHPFHCDGWIHLPGQTLSQDLRIGRGGGWGGYLLVIKGVSHSFFIGITHSLFSFFFFLWLSESLVQFCPQAKGNLPQSQM